MSVVNPYNDLVTELYLEYYALDVYDNYYFGVTDKYNNACRLAEGHYCLTDNSLVTQMWSLQF